MRIDYGQMDFIHPMLKLLIWDMEDEFGEQVGTSLYRKDDPGVHGQIPLRGWDVRCKNHDVGRAVEKFLNKRWKYDPVRPKKKVCLYHNAGGGWHIHLQVHDRTERLI